MPISYYLYFIGKKLIMPILTQPMTCWQVERCLGPYNCQWLCVLWCDEVK